MTSIILLLVILIAVVVILEIFKTKSPGKADNKP